MKMGTDRGWGLRTTGPGWWPVGAPGLQWAAGILAWAGVLLLVGLLWGWKSSWLVLLFVMGVGVGLSGVWMLRGFRSGMGEGTGGGGGEFVPGDLAADLGHELRTPLHGLIGMLSLLRDTSLDPTQSDYVDAAWNSANHLMAVLNNVVDLSRIEAGRMALESESVDVPRLVRDVGGLVMGMTKAKGLGFRTRVDDTMPRWVRMDGTRVRQVLFNLLSNAVKFSERGEIVLLASTGLSAQGAQQLRFVVKDQGLGMDATTVASLFQRFSRGRSGSGKQPEGAGLGLQISMALARLMGGDILVASQPGVGSTFELVLPSHPCSEPEVLNARNGERAAAAGTLRVMVVEDHPVNRQYLAAVLVRLGHEVVVCSNGNEALEAMKGGEFDVVLMDVRMPGMDGFETTRQLRARLPAGERLPVVALTADTSADARRRAVEVGMDDFLAKPVRPMELAAALERMGGRNRPNPARNGSRPGTRLGSASLIHDETIADLCETMGLPGYQALVFTLCDENGTSMAALRRALDAGDADAIRAAAHGMKGAALTLGLKAMAVASEAIEKARLDPVQREDEWRRLVALIPASREDAVHEAARVEKQEA